MNIFSFFQVKNLRKYAPKRTKLHYLKKFSGKHGLESPLANALRRHASQAASRHATRPAPKKLGTLANHTYSHLFEEMRS